MVNLKKSLNEDIFSLLQTVGLWIFFIIRWPIFNGGGYYWLVPSTLEDIEYRSGI